MHLPCSFTLAQPLSFSFSIVKILSIGIFRQLQADHRGALKENQNYKDQLEDASRDKEQSKVGQDKVQFELNRRKE